MPSALLDHVLQEDPNNVSAQETLGFMEFRQGHLEEARKRYAKAVQSRFAEFSGALLLCCDIDERLRSAAADRGADRKQSAKLPSS